MRASSIQGIRISQKTTLEDHGLCYLEVRMMNMMKSSKDELYENQVKMTQSFLWVEPLKAKLLKISSKVLSSCPSYFNRIQSCDEFAGPSQLSFLT